MDQVLNLNPTLYKKIEKRVELTKDEQDINIEDQLDAQEVFEILCSIRDPEYMETSLEELRVVHPDLIHIDHKNKSVLVYFTPTIPNCSMSSVIGLCIKTMLSRCLPNFKPGSHLQEEQINKQLADKERVCAALENERLLHIINKCLNFEWSSRSPLDWIDTYKLL